MKAHSLRCLVWVAAAALLGLAIQAHGQDPAVAVTADPVVGALLELLRGGGLPAVLALVAWWARGAVGGGIPVAPITITVQLPPELLAELKRIRRAIEHDDDKRGRLSIARGDDSDSDDPPPSRAA